MQRWTFIAATLGLTACHKEEAPRTVAAEGRALTINEAVAAGSDQVNEFGEHADWFELHNPGSAVHLKAGEWFVSDDEHEPLKFELPEITVPELGYLVIWCDGMDVAGEQVHANFALAAEGEHLLLTQYTTNEDVLVDAVYTGVLSGAYGMSQGRFPDGTAEWSLLGWPTPGAPNEPVAEP